MHLDLRHLPPPEPIERIAEALLSLPPGERLVAITAPPPEPTWPLLDRLGFAWRLDREDAGCARLTVCHPCDAAALLAPRWPE